jgi:hypothetical protein
VSRLAVHAHFYQPPRDEPATGEIPEEPGAAPFANWNERITAECYRPNAELGNFERLSFDLGPTLATWMAQEAPDVLERIVGADRASVGRQGHGNALAQPYHHTILPLATRWEKQLQVAWGIAEFEHRFGRRPRGMWLPETAADVETLEVLAAAGIDFTILAPWQAHGLSDPTVPYWVELPSGRRIAAFFFVASVSGRLAFDPRSSLDADSFTRAHLVPIARRLEEGEEGEEEPGRLILLATDGELYGHHQAKREFFLARLLDGVAEVAGLQVTTPARLLAEHPPRRAIELRSPGSWSCHHGVDRWARECPCSPGATWKAPLRQALADLARDLDRAYEEGAGELVGDPRRLLAGYVKVVLGTATLADLVAEQGLAPPPPARHEALATLLAAQWLRHRMFASCGFFWSEFDRLEPRNNLAAAAVAQALVRRATGRDPAPWLPAALRAIAGEHTGATGEQVFAAALARVERLETRAVARASG